MVSLGTEPRPGCTGADESTARRIDACCRIDAHRRVVNGVLQVTEEIQSSKDVAGGVCRCRRCEQQLVPIFKFMISLSRKMNRLGTWWGCAEYTDAYNTLYIQHSLKAWMILL